jgi:hypothetical protein
MPSTPLENLSAACRMPSVALEGCKHIAQIGGSERDPHFLPSGKNPIPGRLFDTRMPHGSDRRTRDARSEACNAEHGSMIYYRMPQGQGRGMRTNPISSKAMDFCERQMFIKEKRTPLDVEGWECKPACPYRQIGMVREAICLLSCPLLLRLAFVFPGIAVGTLGFENCVGCVGEACCKVYCFS